MRGRWSAGCVLGVAILTPCASGQARGAPQIRAGTGAWRPAPPVIEAQSNLVPIEVVVRGRDGQIVAGLGRNRFRIYDDGHARPLSQFFVERARKAVSEPKAAPAAGLARSAGQGAGAAPPARYVALWIDDVDTQGRDLEHARNAALDFLHQGFGPSERVGLFTASGTQQVAFTQNVSTLGRALAGVRAHPRANEYGLQESCPRITPYQAYQIVVLNYKEAFQAALAEKTACAGQPVDDLTGKPIASLSPSVSEPILAQARATWEQARALGQDAQAEIAAVVADLAQQPGKRILLIASGGFYSETLGAGQERIVDDALRHHVVINALDAKGLYTESPVRPLGEESDAGVLPLITFFYDFSSKLPAHQSENAAMVEMAESTGGLFFHNSNDLALGFRRLGLAPSVTYELAFTPVALPRDGKFHKLKVELTPAIAGAIIEARRGYYDPEPLTPAEQLAPALEAAMRTGAETRGLPASVEAKRETGAVGVDVHFDVGRLAFVSAHGRHDELLIVIAALFDKTGKFVTGQKGILDLALDGSHYNHFRRQGLGATLALHAPAGTYRLRVVVGEASHGELAAFTQTVTIG